MRTRVIAGLALVGLLAAGCGGGGNSSSNAYTAAATAPCLKQQGFKDVSTDPGKIGFIASFAENGGLVATAPDGSQVTIAFEKDAGSVTDAEEAFRKHASPRYRHHMQDVMSASGNAVIVWSVAPAQQPHDLVIGCLHKS